MQIKQQGFSLTEMLFAMALSSMLLIGIMRLIPTLSLNVTRQSQQVTLQEDLWHLAFTLGKALQRAGYCAGTCVGEGMRMVNNSHGMCLFVQWDMNSNGRWDAASAKESEITAFRWHNEQLEIKRATNSCAGSGWEKISDPDTFRINQFTVASLPRNGLPPLLEITLRAYLVNQPERMFQLRHLVVGYNL